MTTKPYTLPADFGKKWVEALRKMPEEKHHKGELQGGKNKTCYCSIGVCAIANDVKISENGMGIMINGNMVDYFSNWIFTSGFASEIVDLNDRLEKSFSEIADFIEENVEFV